MIKSGKVPDVSIADAQQNYKKALEKGMLKILSKMGISLLSCYHGAQIFEIYGLGKEVVDTAFRGSVSRIGGLSLDEIQRESESFWIKVGLLMKPSFLNWLKVRSGHFLSIAGSHRLMHSTAIQKMTMIPSNLVPCLALQTVHCR